jgi:2-succinyl-6-hydroxy-2,4-cyclohexadiene-1-carboxylate synthase
MSSSEPRLHVETKGSGPVVVLAHGFGGSARNFRIQARSFAGECKVVCYDARGHARSEAPAEPEAYEFERLVDDFERVARESGSERVIAGGVSLGAATALGFARRRPERVQGLLIASVTGETESRRAWAAGFADAIDRDGLEAAGEQFVWGERSRFDPGGAKLIRLGLLEHPPHALSAILRRTLAVLPDPVDAARVLAAHAFPTLIVAGGEDKNALASSEALSHILPQPELLVIPKAGHVVNLAAPEAFDAGLRRLIARAAPPGEH